MGNFKSKWSGSFQIKDVKLYGAIELEDPISKSTWVVNFQRIKLHLGGEVDQLTTTVPLNDH